MTTAEPLSFSEVAALAAAGDRNSMSQFVGLGKSALPAVRAGLGHPDWKVRRNCLRFLDHVVDPETAPMIVDLLRDEHTDVRRWAAHALGCAHCKDGANLGLDAVPYLMEVARSDTSTRVRRSAVVCLAWNQPPQPRIHAFLRELLKTETDAKIRLHASGGLDRELVPEPNKRN